MNLIDFGFDFLWTLRELQDRDLDDFDDAVIRYLLFDWGVTVETVDEANRLFWQRVKEGTLGDFRDSLDRIIRAIGSDNDLKNHLVRDLVVVLEIQRVKITNKQKSFLNGFQELLDMKPSEFQSAISRGSEWAMALQFVCRAYADTNRPRNSK
jgi:hypothetical protein